VTWRWWQRALLCGCLAVCGVLATGGGAGAHSSSRVISPARSGELDCNGQSRLQHSVKLTMLCADPRPLFGERFEDNGVYVGHDEPSIRMLSQRAGSGNDVTFTERLPREPGQLPTVHGPGRDVTHTFELTAAPWFGMALCDANSFPQNPCRPRSDTNAPTATFPGAGGGFTEMQFYPPGFAPIIDSGSCDNTHWCAALLTFGLECSATACNPNCTEPVNFAFIQRDGQPTGPPDPQRANVASFTPNRQTLRMNPGDWLRVHMFDATLAGGAHALEEHIDDLTTGRSGFMIASARNGFTHTDLRTCAGTPFNWQPEYSTAKPANIVPWTALEGSIFTQFEIGHFEPCRRIADPITISFQSFTDTTWQTCTGPYEASASPDTSTNPEGANNAPCYPRGDTHGGRTPPNMVTGCGVIIGPLSPSSDLDYDGTSYWPDWPSSVNPGRHPSPFLQLQPTSGGHAYTGIQFETDAPATESSCQASGTGCAVPPPGAPGNFYPYWTRARVGGNCVWEFGQMPNGQTFGGPAQYGGPSARFVGTLESPILTTPGC